MKLLIGLLVAFVVGGACRVFDIPAPAPPMWQGALLVVSMTLGYSLAGAWAGRPGDPPPAAPVAASVPASGGVPRGEAGAAGETGETRSGSRSGR